MEVLSRAHPIAFNRAFNYSLQPPTGVLLQLSCRLWDQPVEPGYEQETNTITCSLDTIRRFKFSFLVCLFLLLMPHLVFHIFYKITETILELHDH